MNVLALVGSGLVTAGVVGTGVMFAMGGSTPTAEYNIVFNPTGTHVQHGQLKIRLDFYPNDQCKTYDQQHVYIVDEASPEWLLGYPGKVDKDSNPLDRVDYDKWIDGLPHIWVTNPALGLFLNVDENIDKDTLQTFLNGNYTADLMATLDDSLIKPEAAHLVAPLTSTKTNISKTSTLDDKQIINAVNANLANFETSSKADGITFAVQSKSIDIGSGATDRGSSQGLMISGVSRTKVDSANPANATGTLDTLEIWLASKTGVVDIWMGTFSANGNDLTCHDSVDLGDVATGSKQTYSGLSVDVNASEYIGVCCKSGTAANLEIDTSGGSGVWSYSGECIDPTDSQTFTQDSGFNDADSLYGTGTEGGQPEATYIPRITIY